MTPILHMGLLLGTGREGKVYEDFIPNTKMGEYGFGDTFLVVTDCENILEFAIETNMSVHTFKVN